MTAFNSDAIYVFPCARKGGSSLASEYNFTHLSGRVSNKASYVIGEVNDILQVVLDGYYFEIKDEDIDSLCTKKLILWLETLPETDSTGGWAHVTRRVCGVEYDSSENKWKRLQDLDNNGQFSALYTAGADDPSDPSNSSNKISIEDGLTYICLDLNNKTNWVKNIHKGIEDKLVRIDDRVTDLEDASDTYATKKELDSIATTANTAADKAINLEKDIKEIINVGGESNKINTITVNGVNQEPVDKTVAITVPVIKDTMISHLNDGEALLSRTATAEGKITDLETIVNGKAAVGEEGSEGYIPAVLGLVDLVDKVAALEAVDNATQAELDKAIDKAIADVKKYADDLATNTAYDDTELAGRVTAIENNYLKKSDETIYDDTTLAGRVTAVEGKVASLEAAIEGKEIYAIAFDANRGAGIMTPVICISDRYSLPTEAEISFTPPDDNQHFAGWSLKTQDETGDDPTTRIENNELIGIKENTIVYAMWADNTET